MDKEIIKQCGKSIFFTIFPFVIPMIFNVSDKIINMYAKYIIVFMLLSIDVYFVLKISKQDALIISKVKESSFNTNKYNIIKKVVNRLSNCEKIKGGFIKDETYKKCYDYKENILLYNPHRYLERVCEEIKSLMSEITDIDLEYVSVSFIYQYPTLSEQERGWQWITGKGPTSKLNINDWIKKNNSYFHYLISNNIAATFENDKSKLIPRNYDLGEKDIRHGTYGSISAHKMSFMNNNDTFCEGYLIISTYGKKFYDSSPDCKFESEDEFEHLLFDFVIPPFRKIIETELGFLYMRHKYRQEINEQ